MYDFLFIAAIVVVVVGVVAHDKFSKKSPANDMPTAVILMVVAAILALLAFKMFFP